MVLQMQMDPARLLWLPCHSRHRILITSTESKIQRSLEGAFLRSHSSKVAELRLKPKHISCLCYSKFAMPLQLWNIDFCPLFFEYPGLLASKAVSPDYIFFKPNSHCLSDTRPLESQSPGNLGKSPNLRKPGWTPLTCSILTIYLMADVTQEVHV